LSPTIRANRSITRTFPICSARSRTGITRCTSS
jgi:hypothetical protein